MATASPGRSLATPTGSPQSPSSSAQASGKPGEPGQRPHTGPPCPELRAQGPAHPTPPPVLSPPPAGPAPSSCAQPPRPDSAHGKPSWMSEGPGPRTRTCPLGGPARSARRCAVPGAARKGPICSTGPPSAPKLRQPCLGPAVREGTISTYSCTHSHMRQAQGQPQRRVDPGTAPTLRRFPRAPGRAEGRDPHR